MSYMLRVAEANALTSPAWLVAQIGYASACTEHFAEAASLRGPLCFMRGESRLDSGGLGSRFWNMKRPRYCPLCLFECNIWKPEWDLVFCVACERHRVELLESCSHCGKPLSWSRSALMECPCGASLATVFPRPARTEDLSLAHHLSGAWKQDLAAGTSGFAGGATADLLLRIWLLGSYGSAGRSRPQKLANLHRIEEVKQITLAAADAMEDWPMGFHRLLARAEAGHAAQAGARIATRFGRLYNEIFAPSKARAFSVLRSAFEGYVAERWHGQLAARNRRLSAGTREGHLWVPATRAAKELGWKPARVRSAIDRGMVRGHSRPRPSGRISAVVHREDLQALKSDAASWMDLKAVCAYLHVGKAKVMSWITSGVLLPIAGPAIDGHSSWQFRRRDVASLLEAAAPANNAAVAEQA